MMAGSSSWHSVNGESDPPVSISGTVLNGDTGQPIEAEICFKELATGQTIYKYSDGQGFYYLSLDEFTWGWNYGDDVEITILLQNYLWYITTVYLDPYWPDPIYHVDINLRLPSNGEPTNCWGPDPGNVDLICTIKRWGKQGQSGLDLIWDQDTDFRYTVPDANPPYDGVECISYFQVQDNGQWVPPGQTYWVKSIYNMTVVYNINPNNILYYSDNITYINPISRNNPHYYDPGMDAKLHKNKINGRALTFILKCDSKAYYEQSCQNVVPGYNMSAEGQITGRYIWEV